MVKREFVNRKWFKIARQRWVLLGVLWLIGSCGVEIFAQSESQLLEGGAGVSTLTNQSQISFQHFSLNDGLSHTTVFSIVQDKRGYIWIATSGGGLNRYDGNKFTVYKRGVNGENSIHNNNLRKLYIDSNDRLWIGTINGLSCFDLCKERFTNYPYLVGDETLWVNDIIELGEDQFLVATQQGLYRFSPSGGYEAQREWADQQCSAFMRQGSVVWVGGQHGVSGYDEESGKKLASPFRENVSVLALLQNAFESHKVWVATEGSGLFLVDFRDGSQVQYRKGKGSAIDLSSDMVRTLAYDREKRLWVGTFVGLNLLDERSGLVRKFYNTSYLEEEVSQNSIRALYKDSQGGMWCGTYFGGISYYHPLKNQFVHYAYRQGVVSLSDNVVGPMIENSDKEIWIGTNDHGLNVLNLTTGRFRYYRHQEGNASALSGNNVKALAIDPQKKGDVWVGTHDGGLCRYIKSQGRFERIRFSQSEIANSRVYALTFTQQDQLWIGTLDGLFCLNTRTMEVQPARDAFGKILYKGAQVISLYLDRHQGLWVGTQNGCSRFDLKKRQIDPRTYVEGAEVNHDQVYCFYEGANSRVWIGAMSGLYCFSLSEGVYKEDYVNQALPSMAVYGILEDGLGRLWLSSSNGLFMIDQSVHKWKRYKEQDGIQSNQFNAYSYCKSASGRFYFGGINGITAFSPEQLIDNPYAPLPLIDQLTIYNKPIEPGDESRILEENAIGHVSEIEIPAKYEQFTLSFVVPNYLSGKGNNFFAYCLEGFDDEWYYTDKDEVSYSNLRPGKYVFKVKAANNNGVWARGYTSLVIYILPQWYQTWWARLIFLFLLSGIIIGALWFYTNRKLMTKELEMERLDKERVREVEQAKIRFFINVSHEFRTPLTLILSPVQEALRLGVANKWLEKQLKLIQLNALRMQNLVNQVLDYRKAEMGALELKVVPTNIDSFTKEVVDLFVELASHKQITLHYDCMVEKDLIYIDRNYFERIISNLLSNAIKFTGKEGEIRVLITEKEGQLELKVYDTGCGIPSEKLEKIFERFYQVEENAQGTGIGLSFVKTLVELHHGSIEVESELEVGSCFTVRLPSSIEAYAPNERSEAPCEVHSEQMKELVNNNLSLLEAMEETDETQEEISAVGTKELPKLLIVEDDKEVRSYLVDAFSREFQVLKAENGQEGWERLVEHPDVELILSDVMMPVMDGIKFCRKVKENIHYCHIPLLLLTARAQVEDQLTGLRCGADDYIPKPFSISVLHTKVLNTIRHRKRIIRDYLAHVEKDPVEMTSNPIDEEILSKARAIILKKMINPDFSVEELSREMAMSRSSFHLKIKAITGESAIEFIRRIRLAEACRLLKEGKLPLADISTIIGFTPSYFSTIFKKYMGCMPSEYVNRNRS